MARLRHRTNSLHLPSVEGNESTVQRTMTPRRSLSSYQNETQMKDFADMRGLRITTPVSSAQNSPGLRLSTPQSSAPNSPGLRTTTPTSSVTNSPVTPRRNSRRHSHSKNSLPPAPTSARSNIRQSSQPSSSLSHMVGKAQTDGVQSLPLERSQCRTRSSVLSVPLQDVIPCKTQAGAWQEEVEAPPSPLERRKLLAPLQDVMPPESQVGACQEDEAPPETVDRRKSAADIDEEFEELLSHNFGGNVGTIRSETSSVASNLDCDNDGLPTLLSTLVSSESPLPTYGADLVKEQHEVVKAARDQQHVKQRAAADAEEDVEGTDGKSKTYSQRMKGAVGRIAERLAGVRRQSMRLSMTGDLQHDIGSHRNVLD